MKTLSVEKNPPLAMNRRAFLQSSVMLSTLASLPRDASGQASVAAISSVLGAKRRRPLKKGFMYSKLNGETAQKLSHREKFRLLREAGFAGVEVNSGKNQHEILEARDAAGLEIPSVVIATHWVRPLTDLNPSVRETGLEGLKQGLRDAKAYGAKSVLLVPGIVTKEVSYTDAYTRSIAEIAKAVPLAESLGVIIAIENVGNRFLLSPREAAAYVDSFQSPFVQWHFDAGNVADTGWPEHWIGALGRRIVQVHVTEFSRKISSERGVRAGYQVDFFGGDSDWPAVMAAFDFVGYSGWLISEQWRPPDLTDAEWLAHVSTKMDQILDCRARPCFQLTMSKSAVRRFAVAGDKHHSRDLA